MIAPVSATTASAPDPALRKAAQAFEAVFLREMIASMRKARLSEDVFGSSATDNFREMADARTADAMSQGNGAGGFGIAALIEKQLAARQ